MRPLTPPPYSNTLYKNETPYEYNTLQYGIYGCITAVRRAVTTVKPLYKDPGHKDNLTSKDVTISPCKFLQAHKDYLHIKILTTYTYLT
jgi:hypothetical protein